MRGADGASARFAGLEGRTGQVGGADVALSFLGRVRARLLSISIKKLDLCHKRTTCRYKESYLSRNKKLSQRDIFRFGREGLREKGKEFEECERDKICDKKLSG
jgi:hypothetical protein